MEIQSLRTTAENYRKLGMHDKVVEIYNSCSKELGASFDEWDKWRYAFSLRKTGRVKEALQICKESYKSNPDFSHNRSLYSWCLYDSCINKDTEQIKNDESTFNKAAAFITSITIQEQFSPYEKTVLKLAEYYKEKPSFSAKLINEWLDKINPALLSTECFPFKDKEGVDRETASNKEKWYSLKTKALEKLEKYEECINFSEAALREISKFHYDNDIWIKNRIAVSKGKLGNKQEAITELQNLLLFNEHWLFQYEIALFYEDTGNWQEALAFGCDAALNGSDFKIKLPLFIHLGIILKKLNRLELAGKHFLFSKVIRTENNWKIPAQLQAEMDSLHMDESENVSVDQLYRELKKEWLNEKLRTMPSLKGSIKRIHQSGKTGTITGENNKEYFFRVKSYMASRAALKEGLRIEFCIKKSFDMKRKAESEEAVFIRKIS